MGRITAYWVSHNTLTDILQRQARVPEKAEGQVLGAADAPNPRRRGPIEFAHVVRGAVGQLVFFDITPDRL